MHARGRSSGPFALGAALTPATAGVTQGPPSHTGGGEAVTRHRVLTCPSVPAILAAWLQRLTCLTSARFRARAPGPVSGQLCSAPGGRAGHTGAGFLLPFGRRPSLLGASCPARGFRPSYDRPTAPQAARTRAGFSCSARVRPGWLRMPSGPRGRRCPHDRSYSRPPPAASQRPAPAAPDCNSPQDASLTRHQQGFTVIHPTPAFPSPVTPGRNGIPGLSPELCTQPGRTRQRTPGRGRARTLPGLRPWHQPASFDVLTHNVRPHVARTG
jgi:hypothetical protein